MSTKIPPQRGVVTLYSQRVLGEYGEAPIFGNGMYTSQEIKL
jgi:hypothetical protein